MRLRLFIAIVFVALASAIAPLAAHTEVWQRSPAAGRAFGGTIDEVQISFVATVASAEIGIIGPDGTPVETSAATLAPGDRIAVTTFPALTEPGAYIVAHTELAEDGDTQTDSFQFFFDPESSEEVVPLIIGDEGPNWVLLGVISGIVLILAGVFWPGRSGK